MTKFTGTQVITTAEGSDRGLADLKTGKIDLAATSRELTTAEKEAGFISVPILKDPIAIVVGNTNPFRTGLSAEKVANIFMGKINNWSEVGGKSTPIRVIDRPKISGTRQSFQSIALKGKEFGSGANWTSLERDATTPLLQALKKDGIGYATFAQVANQSTVRTVAIDGMTPESPNYPYQRTLSYVYYKSPPEPKVKAFLGFATSPSVNQQLPINSQ